MIDVPSLISAPQIAYPKQEWTKQMLATRLANSIFVNYH